MRYIYIGAADIICIKYDNIYLENIYMITGPKYPNEKNTTHGDPVEKTVDRQDESSVFSTSLLCPWLSAHWFLLMK